MRIVKPKKLKKGEVIGLITPGSSPDDLMKIELSIKYFEKIGYKVELGKNVGKYHGYLAGSDDERVSDLEYMFSKKDVKAIICIRGGYGSPRLLDKINYRIIRDNPKIFVGYSDITALQLAFFAKTGLVTFAGPMAAVDFSNDVSSYTEELFWAIITSNKKLGKIKLPDDEKLASFNKNHAKGRIIGGNLALIISIMGTEYLPQFKDKILLLEDIGELPYRVDRMLNQLKLAKIYSKLNGIILGSFVDCYEHDPMKKTLTLGEVVDDYIGKLKLPVIYNFPHGHIKDNVTVPWGISVKINASKASVEFDENAVS
jgi:muramoyltetrapeptide carboxypeptidase